MVKIDMKKMLGDLEVRLQKCFMTNRLTLQATTEYIPSELMMKRNLRTKLNLRPD